MAYGCYEPDSGKIWQSATVFYQIVILAAVCWIGLGKTQELHRIPVRFLGVEKTCASLCGQQHREDGGIRMADRIDADPAHHIGDGAVRLGFHPGGSVFQAQVRKAG